MRSREAGVPAAVALLVSRQREMTRGLAEAVGAYFEALRAVEVLAAVRPEEVAAALAGQAEVDRDTVVSVVADLLEQVPEHLFEPTLDAVLRHDPVLARGYVSSQYRWHTRVRDGPTADVTADLLARGIYSGDEPAREWSQLVVTGTWNLPPERAWDIFAAVGTSPRARLLPEQRDQQVWRHLWAWVLDLGPPEVYRMDPTADHAATAATLAATHVDAFLAAVGRRTASGRDLTPWLIDLGRDLPGCGMPSCCRPSRFEAELLRRRHNLRRL